MLDNKIQIGTIVTLALAIASGLFWLGKMSQSIAAMDRRIDQVERDPMLEQRKETLFREIDQRTKELRAIDLQSLTMLPAGSILPFAGQLDQLTGYHSWKLCDGSILVGQEYKDSPFYNRPLPKLDGLFLRATLNPSTILAVGGSDSSDHSHKYIHAHELPHTHSGITGDGLPHNAPTADDHHQGGNHNHNFTTNSQSRVQTTPPSPDRTEEKPLPIIPRHANVFYLIKVL